MGLHVIVSFHSLTFHLLSREQRIAPVFMSMPLILSHLQPFGCVGVYDVILRTSVASQKKTGIIGHLTAIDEGQNQEEVFSPPLLRVSPLSLTTLIK